jgi:hypothetical protein
LDRLIDQMLNQNKRRKEEAEMNELISLMETSKVITPEEEYIILSRNVQRKSTPFVYSENEYQDDYIRFKRYLVMGEEDELLGLHLQKFLSVIDMTLLGTLSKQIDDYIFELVKR